MNGESVMRGEKEGKRRREEEAGWMDAWVVAGWMDAWVVAGWLAG